MSRNWTSMPADQAVLELVELLTKYENRHAAHLPIVNAARRAHAARVNFDNLGTAGSFDELTDANTTLAALVETYKEPT